MQNCFESVRLLKGLRSPSRAIEIEGELTAVAFFLHWLTMSLTYLKRSEREAEFGIGTVQLDDLRDETSGSCITFHRSFP